MPLVSGGYPVKSDIAAQAGGPGVLARYNMNRIDAVSDAAPLTTQVMTSVAVNLQAGDQVAKIAFRSGATAAGTPTNWWFALYSPAGVLLAQTADQLTAAWAADTTMDLALATSQFISTPGLYFAAIMVKATTVPSLVGSTLGRAGVAAGLLSTDKVLSQTSGAALTTTAPGTIATPTTIAAVPLVVCH
jgi:hypothetical protein